MTLQTNPVSRREMVQAISERLNSPADYEVPAGQESGEEAAMESTAEAPGAEAEPDAKDSEAAKMELSFPVEDWTVPQLNNLLRTLYSNQYILRRMMLSDALYIDRQLVERLSEVPMEALADFEALLADALATGLPRRFCVQF